MKRTEVETAVCAEDWLDSFGTDKRQLLTLTKEPLSSPFFRGCQDTQVDTYTKRWSRM